MQESRRPTRAVVDLSAIRHNLGLVRERVPEGCIVAAVVKGDGYGHGLLEVAGACLTAGAARLCVALPDEGVRLRHAWPGVPILVLTSVTPEEAPAIVSHDLTQTVGDLDILPVLDRLAEERGKSLDVHLKIDTGMTRLGVRPENAVEFMKRACACRHLRFEGVFSHLATADEYDLSFARKQLSVFLDTVADLAAAGFRFRLRHVANSAAVFTLPESHLDMVRPGMMLYGMRPAPQATLDQRPAMTLVSRLARVQSVPAGTTVSYGATFRCPRQMRIGTVPVGYSDGYPRALSNAFHVLVNGSRAPIVGRVCMNALMVDLTDVPEAGRGDPVLLFGADEQGSITIDEMAAAAGTIPQEILSCISHRVPRDYTGQAGISHPS